MNRSGASRESIGMDRYCTVFVNREGTKHPVAERVGVAGTWLTRLKGLLGKRTLGDDEGLLIVPCRSVHSFGLTFSIDLVYLDKEHIVKECQTLRPGRVSFGPNETHSVLELSAGRANELAVGERLYFSRLNTPPSEQ